MPPLDLRVFGMVMTFGFFLTVSFHLFRRKLGSVPSLILSSGPAYLLIQPLSSGILHTDVRDEIVPLFLKNIAFSAGLLTAVLAMVFISHFLSKRLDRQAYRSFTHMLGGSIIVCFALIDRVLSILFVSVWLVSFLFAETLRWLKRQGREDRLINFASTLLSKAARNPLEERFFAPSFFTLLASLLLLFTMPLSVSVVSILILALADPAAALVGTRAGRHRWIHNPSKSLEGSLAFFMVSLSILAWYGFSPRLLAISLSLMFFESTALEISDNFLIPVMSSMLLVSV